MRIDKPCGHNDDMWPRRTDMLIPAVLCVPHSANLPLVMVFTLHMMGAISNAAPYFEFMIEFMPWFEKIYTPILEGQDGMVEIPDEPNWGIEINPNWLDGAKYQRSTL